MLLDIQTRYGLLKWRVRIEVGVCHAAVAGPEAGIDRELSKVGEPAGSLVRAICLTARQCPEMGKIGGPSTLGLQILVKKTGVADFIVGIIVDVLRHVPVKELQ